MDTPGEGGQQAAGTRTTLQGTAEWRRGQWRVTVTSTLGGRWEYDVIGAAPRPSHGWLAGTPWAVYPGAEWDEEPEGRWSIPVFWEAGEPEVSSGLTNSSEDVTSSEVLPG